MSGSGGGAPAPGSSVGPAVPAALVDAVVDIVRDALDSAAVGPDDHLFDLGFDSLAIVKTAARVRERLDVELPLAAYFDAGTVADLAVAIAAARFEPHRHE
jgi:acyl carrier protein